MALRARMGNRPVLDDDGFAHGVVQNIAEEETTTEKQWESWRWTFETKGTVRPIGMHIWTGLTLNPPDDSGKLNRFTLVCTKLSLVSLEDIIAGKDPETDVEEILGQAVKFKLVKEGGLYRIDLDTLCLDQD